MLRTDKPIYKVILVFNLILIIAAIVLGIIAISSEIASITRILSSVIRLGALLFAGFYILSGYRKNAAKYYKIYGVIFMLTEVMGVMTYFNHAPTVPEVICDVLISVAIFTLVFIKDLGKTKSLIICAFLVIFQIALAILAYSESEPFIVKLNMLMGVDLTCLYGIMTYAKYLDKTERGTK